MESIWFIVIVTIAYHANVVFSGCKDVASCWQHRNMCKSKRADWRAYLLKNCKKTCGFCNEAVTASSTCYDYTGYGNRCAYYKRNDYCNKVQYKSQMTTYCKKTCGFCDKVIKGDCKDKNENCAGWKSRGYCNKPHSRASRNTKQYYNFMRLNCKKTCGFCGGGASCSVNNGGCQDICKMVGKRVQCSCKDGYKLLPDRRKCELKPLERTCGRVKKVLKIGRVVGGVNAVKHKWEWQGGIYYHNGYEAEFVCGGALIEEDLFLTAAHCVDKGKEEAKMTVKLGDHDRSKDETGEQTMKVKKIVIHSQWNRDLLQNDIALLQFEKKAKITETVGTVCLPKSKVKAKEDSECYITGWGQTGQYEWDADILQEAMLPIMPNDKCGQRNVDKQKKSRIISTMLCGGYADPKIKISGCMGDSGGPYVCEEKAGGKESYVLEGVVSWGSSRCEVQHRYTVFTRVSEYIEWINTEKAKLT